VPDGFRQDETGEGENVNRQARVVARKSRQKIVERRYGENSWIRNEIIPFLFKKNKNFGCTGA
jgi:hypothetical protein